MTKEYAILVLDSLSTWLGHERPITEEIVEAIKTLSKLYLPSNLYEAKLTFSQERFPDEKMAPLRRAARIGYEAGAEWMARQGETIFTTIDVDGGERWLNENLLQGDYDCGEEVIVQIRKKY